MNWAHERLRLFEFACQEEVVCTAFADRDPIVRSIDVLVRPDRRVVAHEIKAFDQYIGRGEGDFLAAHGIDGKKAEIGAFLTHGFDGFGGRVEDHPLEFDVQPLRKRPREVDRYAVGFARLSVPIGEDRVAEIDRSTQLAGRRECACKRRVNVHGLRIATAHAGAIFIKLRGLRRKRKRSKCALPMIPTTDAVDLRASQRRGGGPLMARAVELFDAPRRRRGKALRDPVHERAGFRR